jgi:chloramphenicol O-acetyltransferase type A
VPDSNGAFVDVAAWKRREHYALFRGAAQPFFSVTVDVDITLLWAARAQRPRGSFTLATLHALLRAANASEPMRLRLRDGGVWRHARVGVGTTVLRTDGTYGHVRVDQAATYDEFAASARPALDRARTPAPLDLMHETDDLVYHSVVPWLRFTSFTNALPGGDSIPRVVFGKVFEDGRAWRMPVGVEVHHAVVDGLDVARFVEAFQAQILLTA